MKEEKLLKTLLSLGFTQLDAETYLLLEKNGLMKAIDAARKLKVSKQRLYPAIRRLQSKGIVNATLERPSRFSGVPFDIVLDLFAKAKIEEAQRVQQNKDIFLSDWQTIAASKTVSPPAKFTVIEGRSYIYSKIQQMIQETKSQISFVTTIPSLARADTFGLFDSTLDPSRSKIQFRFLTELSEQNMPAMKMLLDRVTKNGFFIEGKTPDLGLKLCPRMVIRDAEETIFFIDHERDVLSTEQDDRCLWTNCSSLVQSFSTMFEDLWGNSVDIQKKIRQIETGKLQPQTSFIQDTEITQEKNVATILSAEKEIIMMVSAESLFRFWRDQTFNQKWAERGVSTKMMAPITMDNFEAAKQLSRFIEVRHIPQSYLETTIVDGRHLFHFKTVHSIDKKPAGAPITIDSFYTNDFEQVKKMAKTIDTIWRNAQPFSSSTLESAVGSCGFMPPPLSGNYWKKISGVTTVQEKIGIKEEDVLNRLINAKQTPKGESRLYGTAAIALIHPPSSFNLPDMLLRINHIDKRSGLGEEDTLAVYLWLETTEGYAYVQAGNIGDNPAAAALRKNRGFADSPAKQNCKLVKKDEIQIRAYGNSLFCGWTIPITLYPKYVLPPSCLLIEGYGKVKTKAFSSILASGVKFEVEQNYFDAFVTFMHPTSKYSGPGTDGVFVRDLVATTIPPKE